MMKMILFELKNFENLNSPKLFKSAISMRKLELVLSCLGVSKFYNPNDRRAELLTLKREARMLFND